MSWPNTAGAKDVWRLANIYANSNDPVNYPDWIPATGTKVSLPSSIQGWLIYRDEQQGSWAPSAATPNIWKKVS